MRFRRNQKLTVFYGALAAIFVAAGAFVVFKNRTSVPVAPPVHEPVRLGGIVPMTGSRAAYGIPLQRAAQLAIDEINKKGGVFGEQWQILWEDGKCLPTSAKVAAEKLVNKSKVQVIFGGVCSQETLAAAPITEAAKVILISPASTASDITGVGQYVFRLTQSDALSGEVAARYALKTLGAKKAALVRENTSYINGIATSFVETFTALGGEITYNQSYRTGARGSGLFAAEAADSKPDVIYLLPDSPTQGLQQLERLRKDGVTIPIIVDEVLLDRAMIAGNIETFEGVIGVQSYFDAGAPRAKKFLEAYQAQYAEEPKFPYFMSNMYDSVYLMKDAIVAVGTDPDKIREWLLSRKAWPGVAGDVTFDANGDYLAKFSIVQAKAGTLEFRELFDVATMR